eukprot:CAMPEP_0181027214 /NCGR_PEP_ID=MMETSP1070-20121207/4050_1 /TAXON_ID=265543 /ORGANISM="Minutocellus polymorphus, Strain NH13" /LENGTH=73 /DNA_ID=CAMNT_0023104451 /DNA_START=583 /DNA_END=804 /DNA_ORIENTATION=+
MIKKPTRSHHLSTAACSDVAEGGRHGPVDRGAKGQVERKASALASASAMAEDGGGSGGGPTSADDIATKKKWI